MGKLVDDMKKKKVIMLEKPSGAIAIVGDMNALQRKFYNVFLYVAKENLKKDIKKDYYSIHLIDIINILELEKPNKQRLKQMIKDLVDIKIEYNYLRKDGETWGISSVLNDVKVDFDDIAGKTVISYAIPRIVRKAMINKNGMFAKIDLIVVKGLKSKYAILLYELIKDYEKVQVPELSIQEFRKMFGIEDKYPQMPNLRKWVLDPACEEINNNPNIDFTVSYKLMKDGKAYTHIKFHLKPKPAKLKLDQQAEKILRDEVSENPDLKELLVLIPKDYRESEKVISLVLGGLEQKGKEYTQAQIEYTNKNAKKNYIAFLKKAIESDYAGYETVALDLDIITPEDAIGYEGYIEYGGQERHIKVAFVEPDPDGEYLARLDDVETGEMVAWQKVSEKRLLEMAKKNSELRNTRRK